MVPPARFEHAAYGLGNRCSIRLSYGGTGSFPRFLRLSGQRRTRETRRELRFVLAQWGAQSVPLAYAPLLPCASLRRALVHLVHH
jgi:hypothetical protein